MSDVEKAHYVEEIDDVEVGPTGTTLDEAGYRLWRKAVKTGTWDPASIDLSEDREQYQQLDEPLRAYLDAFCGAFYNAEENVAVEFCPWVMAADGLWQQAFLSTQLVEEYKHTDFFERYFNEVLGPEKRQAALPNPVHDTLQDRARQLLGSLENKDEGQTMRFVEGVTHYQGIIEGVQANTGYQIFLDVFARKGLMPGLSEGFKQIQRDEGRHVSFGMQTLRHYAQQDERYARRIREMYEEYLPHIRQRYGQTRMVNGKEYGPPEEEQGLERLMALYERRMRDIFGKDSA
ncbi:MAG: R2-like ligand-binding oxidase [Rubrobacter sp.]|nr:R2-like ligand-binding oxidase [Rubrobacter sp.]